MRVVSPQAQTRPAAVAQDSTPARSALASGGAEAAAPTRAQPGATSDGSPEVTVERTARAAAPAAPASPREVVTRFYAAFEEGDTATLRTLYAPDVQFKDAIFSYNDRAGTMHMWEKILADPTTRIKFTLDSVEGSQVKGHWVADYKLGGRPVHNEISTTMTVKDGLITRHTDDFSWNKWAPQALPLGHLATLPGIKQLVQAFMRLQINS